MAKKRNIYGLDIKDGREQLPQGKNYLLTIAIDKYDHCRPLENAVKDADDFANLLFDKYTFFKDQYFSLINKEATKDNIIDTFRKLKKTLKPSDNLLIYYSGHGELDPDFDESYWVTVESRKGKVGDYLSLDRLVKFIRAIKTHHTLLIIDACFAGAALVNRRSGTTALEKDPSRYVLASGRKEFAADGKPGENSPFAAALLEKLRDNNESLLVTDLAQYVKKQTIKATNDTQRPIHNPLQIPEDKGGEFVFHLRTADEAGFWENILEQNTITGFKNYLKKYPEGKYGEEATWQIALKRNTILAYDDYLEEHPLGKYTNEAEQKMTELEAKNAWQVAQQKDSLTAYRSFVRRYPKSEYHQEALNRIKALKEAARQSEAAAEEIKRPTKKAPPKAKIIQPKPKIITDPNTFTDPRDGQVYKTVKLKDGKIWMAQNLNFDVGDGCWNYDNDPKNGKKYGRLYTWEAAQKACPPGWRVPSDEEWWEMVANYGKAYSYAKKNDGGNAGDAAYKALIKGGPSAFSALLGGYRNSDGGFFSLDKDGYYWSSTENDSFDAWIYLFDGYSQNLNRGSRGKRLGFSCRCLQD